MIIRFRGKEGMFRVNIDENNSLVDAINELAKQLTNASGNILISSSPTNIGEPYQDTWLLPLKSLGLKHGDILFFDFAPENGQNIPKENSPAVESTTKEDPLDTQLANAEGRIIRDQTSLCTHGPKGMCEYCQPLEPWDEEYQLSKGIKHVSIHAWRKKVKEEGGTLEAPTYSVDSSCQNGHAPWPRGFCSKCQPPAITLQQQRFRMVDHVEFTSPKIMENFIDYWRQTSNQRIGFLIGKYTSYEDNVPLGIKAEVHAIFEPNQSDDIDSVLLQELPTENVNKSASLLGLQVIGVIFTDLTDAGNGDGKVLTKRKLDSFFLSSLEVAFAAQMQNQFPHHQYGEDKDTYFSSRFVTCCVSGNEFGDIDVACYQASIQAEAMLKADLIVPSTNPSVMRIKENSDTRYVPDIFYKHINEYKLTVQENAKPAFPVDYLLVSLSHGFKNNTAGGHTLLASSNVFTIENRPQLKKQTPSQLVDYIELGRSINPKKLLDFHVLLYLLNLNVVQPSDLNIISEILMCLINQKTTDIDRLEALCATFAASPTARSLHMLAS